MSEVIITTHFTDRDTKALRDEHLGKLPTAAQRGNTGKLRNICLFIGTWLNSIICSSGDKIEVKNGKTIYSRFLNSGVGQSHTEFDLRDVSVLKLA